MNPWPEETKVPLDNVYLFEKNPRHTELQNQEEVIERLCAHERVYELAQSIAEHGLNPLNIPGIVERDPKKKKAKGSRRFEVWEGNRRFCALKLLSDPEKAPARLRAKFAALAENDRYSVPSRIPVKIFKDHDVLRFWMKNIHGGEQGGAGGKTWNAEQKARAAGSVRHAAALAILDMAQALDFIEAEQRKGRITTLDRFLSNREMKSTLGIDASDPASITTDRTDEDFKLLIKRLIDDLLSGKITSRWNAPKITPYARSLPQKAKASVERVEPRLVSEIASLGKDGSKKTPRKRKKKLSIRQKIEPAPDLLEELSRIKNDKLSVLYESICDISAVDHAVLIAVGAWSFIESLSAVIGRNDNASFVDYFSNDRLANFGIVARTDKTAVREAFKRLSNGGNVSKHHPKSATFDAQQIINDMAIVAPTLTLATKSYSN